MTNFHYVLQELDLRKISFYTFAQLLLEKYNQSMFEPIKCYIPPEDYILFFEEAFLGAKYFIHLVTPEFLEYVRIRLLEIERLPHIGGYYYQKDNLVPIEEYLHRYYC